MDDIKDALLDVEKFRQTFEIGLPVDSKENVMNVIRQLEKIAGILYAGPNFFYYADMNSDDPYFVNNSQWGLNGTYGIQAPAAWDITIGSSGLRVGIIDTGIANHTDLNDNLEPGWNFVDNNSNTNDTHGHGTHVAGTVGAVGNNYTGVAGVAWNVKLVPLKINNTTTGQGNVAGRVIDAITYAVNNHIPILNFSWGGFSDSFGFKNAIDSYTGLFVCSAGNNDKNINLGYNPRYPASWVLDNKLTVGAIKSNGQRPTVADWGYNDGKPQGSNYGSTTVDLFAPGDGIYSTVPGGGYASRPGTSMAAPHVAGVAALVYSLHPYMTGAQLKTVLRNSVSPLSEPDLCITNGRLNAYNAVNYIPIAGSIDITFNGTGFRDTQGVTVGQVLAGKYYLFTNGTSVIVERGKMSLPILDFYLQRDPYLVFGSVPAGITTYMNQNNILATQTLFGFSAPTWTDRSYSDPSYMSLYVYFRINRNSNVVQLIATGSKQPYGETMLPTEKRRIRVESWR